MALQQQGWNALLSPKDRVRLDPTLSTGAASAQDAGRTPHRPRAVDITEGHAPELAPLVRELFREYVAWLGVDLKRLWVREPFRGCGVGTLLTQSILTRARHAGYSCLRLDTLPQMHSAHALYQRLGFKEIPPYYPSPIPGTVYLEKVLTR